MKFCKDETVVAQDISIEFYREYFFKDVVVRVDNPQFVSVSKSGGHRIVDFDGICHYIPSGWFKLSFKNKESAEFYWQF